MVSQHISLFLINKYFSDALAKVTLLSSPFNYGTSVENWLFIDYKIHFPPNLIFPIQN